MKTLKRLSATLFLVFCLASAAVCGDMGGPPRQSVPSLDPSPEVQSPSMVTITVLEILLQMLTLKTS